MDAFRNDSAGPGGPGGLPVGSSHGQAALLLTESLMHALVAKGTLSREDFIEVVEGAAEVELELAAAQATAPANSDGSLLHSLANAFRSELGR
jgi:hypothetical protein